MQQNESKTLNGGLVENMQLVKPYELERGDEFLHFEIEGTDVICKHRIKNNNFIDNPYTFVELIRSKTLDAPSTVIAEDPSAHNPQLSIAASHTNTVLVKLPAVAAVLSLKLIKDRVKQLVTGNTIVFQCAKLPGLPEGLNSTPPIEPLEPLSELLTSEESDKGEEIHFSELGEGDYFVIHDAYVAKQIGGVCRFKIFESGSVYFEDRTGERSKHFIKKGDKFFLISPATGDWYFGIDKQIKQQPESTITMILNKLFKH